MQTYKIGDLIEILPETWPHLPGEASPLDYSGVWKITDIGEGHGEETYVAQRIEPTHEQVQAGLHIWYGLYARQIRPHGG